jgi:hypothetical protein
LIIWRASCHYQKAKVGKTKGRRAAAIFLLFLMDLYGFILFGAMLSLFAITIAQHEEYIAAIRNMSTLYGREALIAAFNIFRSVVPWGIILLMVLFIPQLLSALWDFMEWKFPKKKSAPALPQQEPQTS